MLEREPFPFLKSKLGNRTLVCEALVASKVGNKISFMNMANAESKVGA